MAVKLNQEAYNHAMALIKNGLEIEHDTNNWDEVEPTENETVEYLNTHTLSEYGRWFLGIDTEADQKDKSKYLYPTGDLKVIHKSALMLSEREAKQQNHGEIAATAKKLLEMIK